MSRMQDLSVWELDFVCCGCRPQSSRPRVQHLAKAQQRAAASSNAVSVAAHHVVEVSKRLAKTQVLQGASCQGQHAMQGHAPQHRGASR